MALNQFLSEEISVPSFAYLGEQLGTTEATETFFAMTKLFQSKDLTVRRLCYLTIKVSLVS